MFDPTERMTQSIGLSTIDTVDHIARNCTVDDVHYESSDSMNGGHGESAIDAMT